MNIGVDEEQHPALQGHLGMFLCEDVAHATRFTEAQCFAMQGVVEAIGEYAGGLSCEWEQREQVARLAVDGGASRPAQEPAEGGAINDAYGHCVKVRQEEYIRYRMIDTWAPER